MELYQRLVLTEKEKVEYFGEDFKREVELFKIINSRHKGKV